MSLSLTNNFYLHNKFRPLSSRGPRATAQPSPTPWIGKRAKEDDDYDEVPVDGFGVALLGGFGWVPGRGIGKRAKEDVKVVEYQRRSALAGLGFKEVDEVAEVRSAEEEGNCLRIPESRRGGGDDDSRRRRRKEKRRVSWLRSHIRVRVISKELKGGRFYLKKGEVLDVVGPGMCDISMDEGRVMVQGVDQEDLETALPRRGGPVLVLLGKHKGAYGSLVDKDSERETGIVKDDDTQEMLHVRLEQIAEYVGDPSVIGY